MLYPLNPEFDARLKEVFDEIGYPEEGQEVLLELMDRAALAFADKEKKVSPLKKLNVLLVVM